MAALTLKQELFVKEYLSDFNGEQAAIRAGYAPKNAGAQARSLLNSALIIEAVEKAGQKTASTVELSQDYIIDKLLEVAELAVSKRQFAAANKSLELLGKHIGAFKEKQEPADTLNIARELAVRLKKFEE